VVVMMMGAAICGGDSMRFQGLGFEGVPGHVVCGALVFGMGLFMRMKSMVRH